MTVIGNNCSASRWHAMREAGEQSCVDRLPLILQNPLHFISCAGEASFDARLEDAPQIFYRLEMSFSRLPITC